MLFSEVLKKQSVAAEAQRAYYNRPRLAYVFLSLWFSSSQT